MRLCIQDIGENNVWEAVLSVPLSDITLDLPDGPVIVAPVDVKVRAESSKEEVIVLGEVRARIRMSCSRCLNDFETAVTNTIEIITPLRQESIEISDELRQSLLLALPLKPLCQAECRGLCTRCGSNLNQATCACVNRPADTNAENHFVAVLKKSWLH